MQHPPLSLRAAARKAPNTLRLAILGASLLMATPALTGSAYAQVTNSSAQQNFAIPAGPLATALNRFATEAGVVLSFDTALTAGKQSQGLNGSYSVAQGFALLLAGAGLQAIAGADNSYVLVEAGPAGGLELGATNINSSGLESTTEGTGSYTTGQVSVSKLPNQTLKDNPQSVSVITRQRMDDQHMTTMNDVLTQTTGISAYEGGTNDSRYLARGFEITNFRVDGSTPISTATFASKELDMAIYDRVEILRGADGLYSGNGEPGGSVNLVRKRPTAFNQLSISQSVGSWDNYRTELDVSGPLGLEGRLRGRSVIVYQDRNGYMDTFDADRKLFHGVLEADLTESTLITVGYTRDHFNSSDQTYGLPRYSNGSDLNLSRSTFLGGKHDYILRRSDSIYARIEQRLSEDWTANLDAIYAKKQQDRDYYNFSGAIDPITNTGSDAAWSYQDEVYRDRSVDLSLKGSFELLGGQHDAVLGYTWQSHSEDINGYGWASGSRVPAGDIFEFDPNDYPSHRGDTYLNKVVPTYIKQNGVYGSLRIQLADPLHLILGGRYSDYYYSTGFTGYAVSGAQTFTLNTVYSDKNVFTPFAALTYRLSEEWTAYSSVADIYLSQAGYLKGPNPGSSSLDPVRGRSHEIGLKAELFDGRLNTSTALYYIRREGEAVSDTRYPTSESGQGASCCWLADGEVTSKGIEFEINGQITERLEGSVGYTYNHKVTTGSNSTTNAAALTLTPKHLGKAFLTYRMPGQLENLRIGAGVSAQSASYVEQSSLVMSQAGYALYNAFADYRLSENWSVALNGNNLTDKKYYSTVGPTYYGNFYGDPRNFNLTLRGSY